MMDRIKKQLIPILLVTIIMSAIMYIYNADFIIPITLIIFVMQIILFAIFNKIKELGKVGPLLYIIILIIVCILTHAAINLYGNVFQFFVWFLSDKKHTTVIMPYSIACIIFFSFMISSFIYYFTQVIYRSIFLFMVVLIPFVLYSRVDAFHYFYIIGILTFYILLMVHSRERQRCKDYIVIDNTSYKASVLLFGVISIAFTVIIPKPQVYVIELPMFKNSTTAVNNLGDFYQFSGTGNAAASERVLYRVNASEELYLRRQIFDDFNGTRWTGIESESRGYQGWYLANKKGNFNEFVKIIYNIAKKTETFKNKYQLTKEPVLNDNLKNAVITLEGISSRTILSVNNITSVNGLDPSIKIYGSRSNILFLDYNTFLNNKDSYGINYYSERTDINSNFYEFVKKFKQENYESMLKEAEKNSKKQSKEEKEVLAYYREEEESAQKYRKLVTGKTYQNLKELAVSITSGLHSDYEKAKALEQYFENNGFVYDLEYVPEKGKEGVDYFVFQSKRGSCSNYATAMTLMAREIGLPARYVEGFLMTEKEDASYIVREMDSHAFTEVFISGYGWMTFDATVSVIDQNKRGSFLLQEEIIKLIIVVGIILILVLVLSYLMRGMIKESWFRLRVKLMSYNVAIIYMYQHMKHRVGKKLNIKTVSLTANMIEDIIEQEYKISVKSIIVSYEKASYGSKSIEKEEVKEAYLEYLLFYKSSKAESKSKKPFTKR